MPEHEDQQHGFHVGEGADIGLAREVAERQDLDRDALALPPRGRRP